MNAPTIVTFGSMRGIMASTLMTKDKDFYHLSLLYGPPPKVIWIRTGNMTAQALISFVQGTISALRDFESQEDALLHLYVQ